MRTCKHCGVTRPASDWKPKNGTRCRLCINKRVREYKRNNPGYHRKSMLERQYGITLECYDKLVEEQNNQCKICGKDGSLNQYGKLDIDHCHTNGHVRGLLCTQCNTAIGLLGDDEQRIRNAAEYIKDTSKERSAQEDPS